MFKALPFSVDAHSAPKPKPPDDELRARALELVMLELRYQPALKVRTFACGFVTGITLMLGLNLGYDIGYSHHANLATSDHAEASER